MTTNQLAPQDRRCSNEGYDTMSMFYDEKDLFSVVFYFRILRIALSNDMAAVGIRQFRHQCSSYFTGGIGFHVRTGFGLLDFRSIPYSLGKEA